LQHKEEEMTKPPTQVRWLCDVGGTVSMLHADGSVYNNKEGVKRGQLSYLSNVDVEKYVRAGMVQLDTKGPLGRAFATPMWGTGA
jgi:hypothetical protein